MNSYILFFLEFFKVGLFTFGGGYASLPFLYQMADSYHWFTHSQLSQLIAISGLTPGPVGLNMATFSGFNTLGLKGAVMASMALILPMLIVAGIVFRLYKKFCENKYVKTVLYVLRPASCALLCGVVLKLFNDLIIVPRDYTGIILIIILFLMTFKFSRNPIIYLGAASLFGILIWSFKILS